MAVTAPRRGAGQKVTDHPRYLVDYAERRETAHSATHEEVGHGET
jgi:hypothetical protein